MLTNRMEGFIKTDEKLVNMHHIRWMKKFVECIEVCAKSNDCKDVKDTHIVCKFTNPESYYKLNKLF